jgi:hypothetical protein
LVENQQEKLKKNTRRDWSRGYGKKKIPKWAGSNWEWEEGTKLFAFNWKGNKYSCLFWLTRSFSNTFSLNMWPSSINVCLTQKVSSDILGRNRKTNVAFVFMISKVIFQYFQLNLKTPILKHLQKSNYSYIPSQITQFKITHYIFCQFL